jgi:hypothetical protein
MATVAVRITVSKTAHAFGGVFVEGLDVTKAMLPTGNGWHCVLPEVAVGADGDIDVVVHATGIPTVDCTTKVEVDRQPASSKTRQFSAHGNAIFAFEDVVHPGASPGPAGFFGRVFRTTSAPQA